MTDEVPYAFGGPVCAARFRQQPSDFVVTETLPFDADGEGPHWLVLIEKCDRNTLDVLDAMARSLRVPRRALGYSGLKDRFAIARQYVSLPADRIERAQLLAAVGEGWRVVSAEAHRRKLRVGSHRSNAFTITLRNLPDRSTVRDALEGRLRQIAQQGVPAYFGPQRFGHDGANLRKARQLLVDGRRLARHQHRFAVSAARACLFNAVLAARVDARTWNTLLPGEAVSLDGSGSWFPAERLTVEDADRLRRFDVHPSGPLWGSGKWAPVDEAAAVEQAALERWGRIAQGLEALGLRHERRALRQAVRALGYTFENDCLTLSFTLNKGAFATSVLRELVTAQGLSLPSGQVLLASASGT